jgi:hypothetical protein
LDKFKKLVPAHGQLLWDNGVEVVYCNYKKVHLINLFGICLKQKSVVEKKGHCKFLISIHVIVAIVQMHGWKEIKL